MGYYTIRLDPDASKICTIILPWGKYSYSYLRLPMGVAGSPDIFQAKMSELMGTLEFVRTYIDDLLCITKGSLDDHLSKLEGLHQVARCMTKSQCMQIIILCHGNRIPRICIVPRWYETTEKEGTIDSCINATKKCQRVT